MSKPWWLAGAIVWLVVVIALQVRGFDFLVASRIALLAGAVVALGVWFAVSRMRKQPPPTPPKR